MLARAADLGRPVQVQDAERRAQFYVILGRVDAGGLAPALDLDIGVLIAARGHAGVGRIGDAREELLEGRLDFALGRFQLLQLVAHLALLRDEVVRVLLGPLEAAHFLAHAVPLGLQGLGLLQHRAAALIQRWESDLVEVKVPFTATTGPIEMLVGKKRLSAGTFTVVTPHISSLTPRQAERGTILTIIGEHFGETAGGRDPNTMFGVNDVVIGGGVVRPQQWTHDRIEVEIPSNAVSGDVVVRLASSDPLPDGSCCRPAEYVLSNAVSLSLIPTVRVDPLSGPVGTKVVLFGQGFGADRRTNDAVLIAGQPATIAQWKDDVIVVHVPLGAKSGPVTIKSWGRERTVAHFTVHTPKVTKVSIATKIISRQEDYYR